MYNAVLTETAKKDIIKALKESGKKHGLKAKTRYTRLIRKAIKALEKDAETIGVQPWDETRFMYHLRFSRHEATIEGVKVNDPSHYVFFKVNDAEIVILRILHERSDFDRHL